MRTCRKPCIYQESGICTLYGTAVIGQPSCEACITPKIKASAQLGSPHRYCEPESAPNHPASVAPLPGMPGSHTV